MTTGMEKSAKIFENCDAGPQWKFLSQALLAHSAVMTRLGINLVEGKLVARETVHCHV